MPYPRTPPAPILPDRVRRIGDQSFAFLPHRFLRDGFLQSLSPEQLRLYLLFVLAADRDGISFYSHARLCATLASSADAYLAARDELRRKDLIAVDGPRVQVLSLPTAPICHIDPPLPRDQQLSACQNLIASLARRGSK
jgi:hypothetical protein